MSTGKRSKDDGKTKMYKVVKEDTKKKKTKPKTKEDYVKESEVNKKNKKGKKKGKHPKLKKALIIIFIIFIFLLCLFFLFLVDLAICISSLILVISYKYIFPLVKHLAGIS